MQVCLIAFLDAHVRVILLFNDIATIFRELLSEMDEMDYEEVTELLHVWYEIFCRNACERFYYWNASCFNF